MSNIMTRQPTTFFNKLQDSVGYIYRTGKHWSAQWSQWLRPAPCPGVYLVANASMAKLVNCSMDRAAISPVTQPIGLHCVAVSPVTQPIRLDCVIGMDCRTAELPQIFYQGSRPMRKYTGLGQEDVSHYLIDIFIGFVSQNDRELWMPQAPQSLVSCTQSV